jgi:phosphate starvation-inducible PhoH-like protein
MVSRPSQRELFFQRLEAEAAYEKKQPVPTLEPKNTNQRTALKYLTDDKKKVVFLTGSAGTGKSLLAAYRAASQLKSKKIKKVFLVRPAVSVGKSVGMLPGDIKEKLAPYFAQTMAHLRKFLGDGHMTYCLEKEVIEMKPVEYLRGMSFEDCMVIAEEVQNFTAEEMEMMLTRLGDGCQIIFTGDTKQHDLKGISGLEQTINLLNTVQRDAPSYLNSDDLDELDDGIGIVQFMPADVVRSGLTKAFVKMYYNN